MVSDLKLVLVNIFHRHGERAPLKTYEKPIGQITACTKANFIYETLPQKTKSFFSSIFRKDNTDPFVFELKYRKELNGECAPGQLTDFGKRRLYNLGKYFKKQYVDTGFVSRSYNEKEVHLSSTDFMRTIESLQSVIKGLFVSNGDHIPIHIGRRGVKSDYTSKYCRSYLNEKTAYRKNVLEENKEKIENVFKYVRKNFPALEVVKHPYELFDVIHASIGNANKHFVGFCPKMMRTIEKLSLDLFFGCLKKTTNLQIYRGRIIKDLHDRIMQGTKSNYDKAKMFILSGHDTTLYPLLMAFNIHDGKWPYFGANLVYETYKDDDGKHYVKVKYNGKDKQLPDCKKFYKNDKSLCALNEFLKICREYIPKNKDKLCDHY